MFGNTSQRLATPTQNRYIFWLFLFTGGQYGHCTSSDKKGQPGARSTADSRTPPTPCRRPRLAIAGRLLDTARPPLQHAFLPSGLLWPASRTPPPSALTAAFSSKRLLRPASRTPPPSELLPASTRRSTAPRPLHYHLQVRTHPFINLHPEP